MTGTRRAEEGITLLRRDEFYDIQRRWIVEQHSTASCEFVPVRRRANVPPTTMIRSPRVLAARATTARPRAIQSPFAYANSRHVTSTSTCTASGSSHLGGSPSLRRHEGARPSTSKSRLETPPPPPSSFGASASGSGLLSPSDSGSGSRMRSDSQRRLKTESSGYLQAGHPSATLMTQTRDYGNSDNV
ncbi:hypothetical protein EXIGLDRAFT_358647 [Exidia glandulosa HHB12029]|uniref:Uncharacterized protein n=1 Tax=Exidia glandulosa HHB12029 TaxID=1314781 RepID=A0A165C890_EXIGL|nr:hypothetical protein EXIGLDRAFT_358647 [Exidia glandulosa HHB12029]